MIKSEIQFNAALLAAELIEYLEASKKTLSKFSKETGVSLSTLSRIQAGNYQPNLMDFFVIVWHISNGEPNSLKPYMQYNEE